MALLSNHSYFSSPARGFFSREPAPNWQHSLLTGNGTLGAMIPGHPYDETIYLSHASLYLPSPEAEQAVQVAPHLETFQELCLSGQAKEAAELIDTLREESGFTEERDRFIAAFALKIQQPEGSPAVYQRRVDYTTAEACVSVEEEKGNSFERSVFASRDAKALVFRLKGNHPLSATFSFHMVPVENDEEQEVMEKGIERIESGSWQDHLFYRAQFSTPNETNPVIGYEGLGRVVTKGGATESTPTGISVTDADEVLILIAIRPQQKGEDLDTLREEMKQELASLDSDYETLLASHLPLQSELMERASLSLNASEEDRQKPTEDLFPLTGSPTPSLSRIERAFDAGRYNIICSTGVHPPNLQGLWSATWLAPWYGSFTTNGNLPCALAFMNMGNTPELLEPFFRYCDERWDGFRENCRTINGMPGFHMPAQLTITPRYTNFQKNYPHIFAHSSAPWALQFYMDYAVYTGDEAFLKERTYPLMKEAASFFEAYCTRKDDAGNRIFVPSYSPENGPNATNHLSTQINATMDVAVCRQLLQNCIDTAKRFGCDEEDQQRWAAFLEELPPYEVNEGGYFREWLWPGIEEGNEHRHASHLYALYDSMAEEILSNPELVAGVANTIRARLEFHKKRSVMAFGLVQIGLAATRIGRKDLVEEVINFLADHYWSTGMGSFHDAHNLFNTDISGGFPYLCSSALVYADPGRIVFFPAVPERWTSGSLCGIRLRGAIILKELIWSEDGASATLVAELDQTVTVEAPGQEKQTVVLKAKEEQTVELAPPS